jgi:hypothetical protein
MTCACHRCTNHGKSGLNWHATGHLAVNQRGRRQAALVCNECGFSWMSGLPAALDVASALCVDDAGEPLPEEQPVSVPVPTLPAIRTVPTSQPYAPLRNVAAKVEADFKMRQIGEEG